MFSKTKLAQFNAQWCYSNFHFTPLTRVLYSAILLDFGQQHIHLRTQDVRRIPLSQLSHLRHLPRPTRAEPTVKTFVFPHVALHVPHQEDPTISCVCGGRPRNRHTLDVAVLYAFGSRIPNLPKILHKHIFLHTHIQAMVNKKADPQYYHTYLFNNCQFSNLRSYTLCPCGGSRHYLLSTDLVGLCHYQRHKSWGRVTQTLASKSVCAPISGRKQCLDFESQERFHRC
ncbi:hypothetical protein Hanom_Chr00s098017g01802281 [Helianthus anomalus]